MRYILYIFFILLLPLSSCNNHLAAPSGKSRSHYSPEPGGGKFKANSRKGRKAPQMGFYEKRTKKNIFTSAKHSINYRFANKDKKHKLNNDKRSSSQSYANTKQKDSSKNMNKTFVKGKRTKYRRKNRSSDNNKDSFSAPTNQKRKKSKK